MNKLNWKHAALVPFGNSSAESQRDSGVKPRVARDELPWEMAPTGDNPNGVAAGAGSVRHNPVGVGPSRAGTQGSSLLATLGWQTQSLRDCRTQVLSGIRLRLNSAWNFRKASRLATTAESIDRSETKAAGGRVSAASWGVLCLLIGLLWESGLRAQSPADHASHHPGQAGGAMPAGGSGPAPAATPGSAGGMGGMMEGMGEMMKGMMGGAKTKELYPSLMDLPDLPLTKRLEVEQQAGERMRSGVALMNESLDYLLQATEQQNYTAMQAGTASLREGLARFESGLAAQRALAEGKAPRNVALTWFKRDMNLLPLAGEEPHTVLGVTPFHLFTMVLLVAFALAMVAMYFFKMRRAAALFGRIEADKKSPPPGSAPPLAGGKPPDGKKPPSGDKPAAT